jgi:hypothetical protein
MCSSSNLIKKLRFMSTIYRKEDFFLHRILECLPKYFITIDMSRALEFDLQ